MDFTSEAYGAVVAGALDDALKVHKEIEDVIAFAEYLADLERIAYVKDFVDYHLSTPGLCLIPSEQLFYEEVRRKCIELDVETRHKMHELFAGCEEEGWPWATKTSTASTSTA